MVDIIQDCKYIDIEREVIDKVSVGPFISYILDDLLFSVCINKCTSIGVCGYWM